MIDIESVPMPVRKAKPAHVPRKKGIKVTPALREAAKQYKQAYKAVYNLNPTLTYDGNWVRLAGLSEGVSVKRLKELTRQLNNRRG